MRGIGLRTDESVATDELINETVATDRLEDVLPVSVNEFMISLFLAVIVLVVGWYLSKFAVRLTGRTVARRIERPSVTRTVLRGVRAGVLLITLLIVAAILGVGELQILLSVGVFSAVVGIVLAPLIGSLINGLFILTDRPFEIGDMIEIVDEGHRGFVEDITIRYTKIFTLDNTFIVIPNSEIHTRDVINYSAEDERTRVSVRLDVTYESDLEEACELTERAIRGVEGVIAGGPDIRIGSARYPAAPRCHIAEYGDDGITLVVRFWTKHPYKLLAVKSEAQRRIGERFAEAGIEFAYPHRHHVFDDDSGRARVAVSTERPEDTQPRPVDEG